MRTTAVHRSQGPRRGFTILELLVTISIIGILLGFVSLRGPAFLAQFRLGSAARQVATDLRLVRAKATGQTSRYRMSFPVGPGYLVDRDDGAGNWIPQALYSKALTAGAPVMIGLPDGVTIDSSVTVIFESRGNTDATHTITLRDPALPSARRYVDVSFAGQVTIR